MDFKILLEEGPVDSVIIYFKSWSYLQLNKMVDVEANYKHIRLATVTLLESTEFLTKCIRTIIVQKFEGNGLHYDFLENEFQKATGDNFKISDFFTFSHKENELRKFLKIKGFHINRFNHLTLSDNSLQA